MLKSRFLWSTPEININYIELKKARWRNQIDFQVPFKSQLKFKRIDVSFIRTVASEQERKQALG